jgi:hypothetical protein
VVQSVNALHAIASCHECRCAERVNPESPRHTVTGHGLIAKHEETKPGRKKAARVTLSFVIFVPS